MSRNMTKPGIGESIDKKTGALYIDTRIQKQQSNAIKHPIGYMLGKALGKLGVSRAYGVIGGNVARLVSGMEEAGLHLIHTRHESGAAFMAAEDSLCTQRPSVVFTTTGPGWTNALSGLVAATYEGAKILAFTGATEQTDEVGFTFQPQHGGCLTALRALAAPNTRIGFSLLHTENELYRLLDGWHAQLQAPGGFLGSALIPISLQCRNVAPWTLRPNSPKPVRVEITDSYYADLGNQLHKGQTVVLVGWGSRRYAEQVQLLVDRLDAAVLSTPRAKGIYPERRSQYLGITGHGGHPDTINRYRSLDVENLIILGTRLAELTSYYDPSFTPKRGVIHVDADPLACTTRFLQVPRTSIIEDIGVFIRRLLNVLPINEKHGSSVSGKHARSIVNRQTDISSHLGDGLHPAQVISAVQRRILDRYPESYVAAEGGNAWAWGPHALLFSRPRWRLSTDWASMGHFTAGVVGLALASDHPAIAMVGDGSMLMQTEISTAVHYRIPAKWLVWNDAGYGMARHGLKAINLPPMSMVDIPRVDFASWATAQGAHGIQVESADDLEDAIDEAMRIEGPVVVDLPIDPSIPPPFGKRNDLLMKTAEKH